MFCDFENIALGVRDAHPAQFDIHKLFSRLLLTPARACILAIDAGDVSGHALCAPEAGRHALLDSGYCGDWDEREQVCRDAVVAADTRYLPLVVVAEDWPSGAFPNATAYASVREANLSGKKYACPFFRSDA